MRPTTGLANAYWIVGSCDGTFGLSPWSGHGFISRALPMILSLRTGIFGASRLWCQSTWHDNEELDRLADLLMVWRVGCKSYCSVLCSTCPSRSSQCCHLTDEFGTGGKKRPWSRGSGTWRTERLPITLVHMLRRSQIPKLWQVKRTWHVKRALVKSLCFGMLASSFQNMIFRIRWQIDVRIMDTSINFWFYISRQNLMYGVPGCREVGRPSTSQSEYKWPYLILNS